MGGTSRRQSTIDMAIFAELNYFTKLAMKLPVIIRLMPICTNNVRTTTGFKSSKMSPDRHFYWPGTGTVTLLELEVVGWVGREGFVEGVEVRVFSDTYTLDHIDEETLLSQLETPLK